MKKRLLLIMMMLIVGLSSIIFVACGNVSPNNISLSVASGLENETLNLVAHDEEKSSGDIVVKINNYSESISNVIHFSSDSSAISISEPKYIAGGSAKITVTAVHGGTAFITATTAQFDKKITFKVVVKEKIVDFSLKSNKEIYYESGSEGFVLNLEDYINFSPKTTTERELLVYNGAECLTENGITTIKDIEEDTFLTIVSPNLSEKSVSLRVKVVKSLRDESIEMLRSTYDNNKNQIYSKISNGETINLLRGNIAKVGTINSEEVQLKIAVKFDDKNLNICAKVYTKQNNEFVENKYQLAEKQSSSFAGGEHETIFKVQYSGETEMKIVISFEIYGYTYSITKEVFIKTLDAPSNVSINNETTRFAYTVYTTSEAYIGKKLTFKIFPGNSISYKAYIYLDFNADNALFIKNAQGKIKDKENASDGFSKKVAIRSDETIYIAGNNVGSIGKNQKIVVRIEYVFDNINYYFDTEIDISIKKTPTDVKVLADGTLNGQSSLGQDSVTNLALDINSTGTRLTGTGKSTDYDAKSYADLFVYAEVEGYLELGHDYYVINNSSVVEIVTSGDKVKILAKSVGIANVSFVFETGKRVNISINVISSVDKYDIVFPSNIQNSNVYSLTESTNENCLFDIILLTGSKIYPTITTSGQLSKFAISCTDDSGLYQIVSYTNGCFTILEDTTSFRLCTISFQYSYINGTKIDTQDVTIQFQVKSISEISKYYLTTNKKGTSFSLYDYSRVGYYFQNLSTALITLNIEPEGLRSSFISSITWSTNVGKLYKTSEQGSDVETYEHDYFMLSYDTKTGIATILCNVKGEYSGETISLTAKFERAITDEKTETYERSVKFDIIQNKKIDEITSTLKEISIDKNNNNLVLYTSIFPEDASSRKLDIKFIPNDLKDQNAITLTAVGDKVSIKLNDGYTSGSGIIRIIAMDSYTSPSSFTTYLDIPLVIRDGSVEYPYKITKTEDLEIIKTTNYEKCYQIVGQVELTDEYIEIFSQKVFKGKLTGANNAKLTNIKLNTVREETIGLFKEIAENAVVENITFEGAIDAENITPENEINIGLIAGINNGTLKNVFVILGQSKVSSSGSYKINIGGVVGQNNGEITASGTLVRFTSALTFTDIGSHNSEHILLIGGVTGKNTGTISGGASNAATEINNASTTADVNIIVLSKITTKNNDGTEIITTDVSLVTGENEGIGAIAGYSNGALTGLKAIGEICAGKFSGGTTIEFDGYFNNVGGLVGYNSANITNSISQVFVRGKTNVGGLVGSQKGGELSDNKVQALEKTSRAGYNAALIIGNENVGGIAGQVYSQSESVDKCTFISYISKTHNGDIIVYNASSTSVGVGRLVGNGGEAILSNCVAIADVNYTKTTDENFKEKNAIFGNVKDTASNFITKSSFLGGILSVSDISDNCSLSEFITALSKVAEANKEDVAYIILPPTEIKFELTENGKNQQLKTNSSEDQLMFYLFYHQKLNAEKQNEFDLKNCYSIAELIKITLNSNTSTKLTSSNTSVFKIDGSNFVVSGTGLVEITVTSEFNTSLNKKFYVFVTNYFSNFDMFLNADKTSNQITNNSAMSWDKNSSYMLYFNFLDKYNTEGYFNYSDLKVAIYLGDELLYAGNQLQFINFLNISFDAYQISFTSLQKTPVAIKILPYFEITINGKTYSTLFSEKVDENEVLNNNLNKEISFSLKVLNLTSKIESSETEVDVMPFYTPTFDINLTSENDDETITISILKFENGVYTLSEDLECKINNINRTTIDLNAATEKSFTLAFSLKDEFRKISKKTTYKIVISSTNGKTCEIIINYIPQKPDQVDMNLYPYIDTKEDHENYSYISSNKINPGPSLLELLIVPSYSHYQYITIKNLPTNEYKIVFESLYSRETSRKIVGAIDIDGGIKIPKSVVDNLGGRFCIRIFLDYRITDLTTLGLEVEVVSDEAEVIKSFTKTLFVEHLPGVNISIDSVRETSDEQKLKLANGLEYDVDLNIKGFDFGSELKYNSTSGTYTLGEVTIMFSNPQLATLFRNSDGTFTLKVSGDTNINDRTLTITAYGEKVTETGVKKSTEFKFYIEVVHFIVKESDNTKDNTLSDIVSGISNNIRRGAVGDSFVLEITLNNDILIYDKSNKTIEAEVEAFLKGLTENGSWFAAVLDSNNQSPNYVQLTGNNDQTTPAIEIEKVGNKFVIKFKQIERSPSILFKFEAKFDYTNGVPTCATDGNYNLIQAGFGFEITERTSLTNPYPIKTVDDFINMVDGNYYILLDDITLPNDFEPITAKIGGFDGNNKKIKFESNININNAGGDIVYNFGLFESISENTIISNLILEIGGVLTVDLSSYDSINFGLLASENNGTITNCSIVGRTTTSRIEVVGLDLTSASSEPNNIIAAFVAKNYGSITNSRVEVSIEGKGNVAGFVYENNGTIASSYFYGTVANETTSTASKTGGFVGVNNFDGLIFTSYITGDYEDAYLNENFQTPFATSSNKFVATKHRAGAFVYTNYGKISNCYANIPVSATATRASGFVYSNEASGSIEYCYSTSKMSNYNIGHTVFIGRSAEQLLNKGKLLECFAVEEVILSLGSLSSDGKYLDSNMTFMNYKIGSNSEIEKDGEFIIIRNTYGKYGCKVLNIDGTDYVDDKLKTVQQKFADPTTFGKFALSNDTDLVTGVWFMPTSRNLGAYTRNEGNVYINLTIGRPELVSPNLLVYGHKTENGTRYDANTGETTYLYSPAENEGSLHNPYVISKVEELELIAEQATEYNLGENKYYRLVNDIVYELGTTSSKLYRYNFLGNLEGNSFKISNYVIDSSDALDTAGFFASIGTSVKQMGSIKNVDFAPKYINLPNTNSVGAVAGSSYGANIINVSVDGYENDYEGIVILGRNLVGGVVGYATGNYIFNNISVNISCNATYRAVLNKDDVVVELDKYNKQKVSEAGLVVGGATGYGKFSYIYVKGNNVSIGECAGLVFGYIDKNIVANNITVTSSIDQYVKADIYGGVIAGASNGKIVNANIIDEIGRDSFFAPTVYTPIAIGNIVGFMIGGEISAVNVLTNTRVKPEISYVGGAVGIMQGGKLDTISITGEIKAGAGVGGFVGFAGKVGANGYKSDVVYGALQNEIKLANLNLKGNISSVSSQSVVTVGKVIGLTKLTYTENPLKSPDNVDNVDNVDTDKINIEETTVTVESAISITNYSFEQNVEFWCDNLYVYTYIHNGEPERKNSSECKPSQAYAVTNNYKLNGDKQNNGQ